jgi:hypothetical protein
MLPVLYPDAAEINIGAEEIFVAVPPDRAVEPVQSFGTFTCDLHALADWLEMCQILTVGDGIHEVAINDCRAQRTVGKTYEAASARPIR